MITREEGEGRAADSEKETPERAVQRDMSSVSKGGWGASAEGGVYGTVGELYRANAHKHEL